MRATSLFVASLAAATLSFAPANAGKIVAPITYPSSTGNCSATSWPRFSAEQCSKPVAHSYTECAAMVRKTGADSNGAWWWCSSQGFKN